MFCDIWLTNRVFWVTNRVFWNINRVSQLIWLMFSIFTMFSMVSKLSPCSPIWDSRIPQLVETWLFLSLLILNLMNSNGCCYQVWILIDTMPNIIRYVIINRKYWKCKWMFFCSPDIDDITRCLYFSPDINSADSKQV